MPTHRPTGKRRYWMDKDMIPISAARLVSRPDIITCACIRKCVVHGMGMHDALFTYTSVLMEFGYGQVSAETH